MRINGYYGIKAYSYGVVPIFAAALVIFYDAHIYELRLSGKDLAQGFGWIFIHSHGVGKIVSRPEGNDSQPGTLFWGKAHESVDDFVDCSISAGGYDEIVAIFYGLLGKLYGVSGVDGSGPVCASVFIHHGAEVGGLPPGLA